MGEDFAGSLRGAWSAAGWGTSRARGETGTRGAGSQGQGGLDVRGRPIRGPKRTYNVRRLETH